MENNKKEENDMAKKIDKGVMLGIGSAVLGIASFVLNIAIANNDKKTLKNEIKAEVLQEFVPKN